MANVYRTGSIGLASWCMCARISCWSGVRARRTALGPILTSRQARFCEMSCRSKNHKTLCWI